MNVTIRLKIEVLQGKKKGITHQTWEQEIEKDDPLDLNPLVLEKSTNFGVFSWRFELKTHDGHTAEFHSQQVRPSSALLRDLPNWGYRRIV